MFITNNRAKRDFTRWGQQIADLVRLSTEDWSEVEKAATELEAQNSRFKQHDHVLAFAVPLFLTALEGRSDLRYLPERYASLLERIAWNLPRPLTVLPLMRSLGLFYDPADLMEELLRQPFDAAWRAEHAAEFIQLPSVPRFVLQPIEDAQPGQGRDAEELAQQGRSDFECWGRDIMALEAIPPERWDDLLNAVSLLERANPRFRSREQTLAVAIPLFLSNVQRRKHDRHTLDHYVTLLDQFSWQFPQPLVFLYVLNCILKKREDPAFLLERAEKLAFDPAWLTNATNLTQ